MLFGIYTRRTILGHSIGRRTAIRSFCVSQDPRFPREPVPPGQGVGAANIEWSKLFFEHVPTYGHVRSVYKNGNWSPLTFHTDPYVPTHVLANVFHYGQAAFEGLKCFHSKDGKVRLFSDRLNWERLVHSCSRLRMPPITWDMWKDSVDELVKKNSSYIPPYGSNGALYVRPFIIGSGPQLGVAPSAEYTFVAVCSPVGSYYRTKKLTSLRAFIPTECDRTAPLGIGDAKAAANYAADLDSLMTAKEQGYPICLYLDPVEGRYVTEFNTSNFIAIQKGSNTYITPPPSRSILNSVTNRRLSEVAERVFKLRVERRMIDYDAEVETWNEVGAVGTAVVVTPIKSITKDGICKEFHSEPIILQQLHDYIRALQVGDEADRFGWLREVRI
jgi:branched-chain amino acid aminotransferase